MAPLLPRCRSTEAGFRRMGLHERDKESDGHGHDRASTHQSPAQDGAPLPLCYPAPTSRHPAMWQERHHQAPASHSLSELTELPPRRIQPIAPSLSPYKSSFPAQDLSRDAPARGRAALRSWAHLDDPPARPRRLEVAGPSSGPEIALGPIIIS